MSYDVNTQIAYIGSDMTVELENFQSVATGAHLPGATVSVTLFDKDRTTPVAVTGSPSWPLAMAYVTGSKSTYKATLPAAMTENLTEYGHYIAKVVADGGAGKKDTRWIDIQARYRR